MTSFTQDQDSESHGQSICSTTTSCSNVVASATTLPLSERVASQLYRLFSHVDNRQILLSNHTKSFIQGFRHSPARRLGIHASCCLSCAFDLCRLPRFLRPYVLADSMAQFLLIARSCVIHPDDVMARYLPPRPWVTHHHFGTTTALGVMSKRLLFIWVACPCLSSCFFIIYALCYHSRTLLAIHSIHAFTA